MNNYITVTDNFNPEIIDNDIIVPNKTYFNIYNNSIEEPFHKFWFYIDNAKLTNIYKENNIYRFAINNKNEKNKKILDYLKKLFEYIKTLFNKIYTNISVEIPWKEYENYPYLMNFFSNETIIYLNPKDENKNLNEIQKDQSYSILFELTYIQLIKIISGEDLSYSIKFKFNLILIQEKELDKKAILLNNINQINFPKHKIPYNQIINPVQNIIPENLKPEQNIILENLKIEKNVSKKSATVITRPLINPLELMSKIKNLNRVDKNEKKEKEKEKDNEPEKDITQYIEQKNKLKKVETEEKSLLPILKKEYEDLISQNNAVKSLELDEANNNSSELDKLDELDELDKLDKLEKNIELVNSKNKKTNSKKQKKINKMIEKSDIDLELEFENIAKI